MARGDNIEARQYNRIGRIRLQPRDPNLEGVIEIHVKQGAHDFLLKTELRIRALRLPDTKWCIWSAGKIEWLRGTGWSRRRGRCLYLNRCHDGIRASPSH